MSTATTSELYDLVERSEDWLMERVLRYAKERGYARYTSTLLEAWRASIEGLSAPLLETIRRNGPPPELDAESDFREDPSAAFGVLEAEKHRERGITLGLFLGLFKYYRQAYVDLVTEAGFNRNKTTRYRTLVDRFFDRVELGFCSEWASGTEADHMAELQTKNRLLTNEKNKYLTIFESLDDPVVFLDSDLGIENMNHAALSAFTDKAVSGAVYYGCEPCAVFQDQIESLLKGHESGEAFEGELETRDGPRLFAITQHRVLDVSDKFTGLVLILRDISGTHRAEAALRASEMRFRNLVESTPDWVWEVDAAGVYTYVSPKVFDILGYKEDEVVGKTPFDLMPPGEAERIKTQFLALAAEQKPLLQLKNINLHKDGHQVILETSGMPVYSDKGVFMGYRGIDRDITGRVEAERTLRYSQKIDSLGNLAGGIAHNLNNLLLPILSLSGLTMKNLPEDSRDRIRLAKVVEAAETAKEMVSQILAFSRRTAAGDLHLEPIDLREAVRAAFDIARVGIPSSIHIVDDFEDIGTTVLADRDRVMTVVLNLMSNAADAFQGKVGRLTVSLRTVDISARQAVGIEGLKPGRYARLGVADTGHGMDETTLARIFDPFFTTKAVGQGAGLGLSVVHGIVKQHGGAVSIASRPKKGTSVEVYLPVSEETSPGVMKRP